MFLLKVILIANLGLNTLFCNIGWLGNNYESSNATYIPFCETYVNINRNFITLINRPHDIILCGQSCGMMTSSNGNIFRVIDTLCSPHKGQWRRALMYSLVCAWINGWVNNREAGDLRRHRVHERGKYEPGTHTYVSGYVINHNPSSSIIHSSIIFDDISFSSVFYAFPNIAHRMSCWVIESYGMAY